MNNLNNNIYNNNNFVQQPPLNKNYINSNNYNIYPPQQNYINNNNYKPQVINASQPLHSKPTINNNVIYNNNKDNYNQISHNNISNPYYQNNNIYSNNQYRPLSSPSVFTDKDLKHQKQEEYRKMLDAQMVAVNSKKEMEKQYRINNNIESKSFLGAMNIQNNYINNNITKPYINEDEKERERKKKSRNILKF